jgi:hypothetical protein
MATVKPNVLAFRVQTYARAIFVYGTNRLTARDGYPGVADGYYVPVEQYAAVTYTQDQLDLALASGWITQAEYDETMTYKV